MRLANRRILLVGAGHTNLHIVRMWMQQPIADTSLTLISPFPCATYSGMLPGTLAGLYDPSEMEIDLHRLTKAAGVELLVDEAIAVDPELKQVLFRERPALSYSVVSIGVGSMPRQMDHLRTHPGFVPIKPMFTVLPRLDLAIQRIGNAPVRITIVGGGAAGVEVAFCVEHRIRKSGGTPQITLVDANTQILTGFRRRTLQLVAQELHKRGIYVRQGGRVTGHRGLDLTFDDGGSLTADVVIWVTGAVRFRCCSRSICQSLAKDLSACKTRCNPWAMNRFLWLEILLTWTVQTSTALAYTLCVRGRFCGRI